MKYKATHIFYRLSHFSLGTLLFFSSMLISCGEEQGSWTSVQQEAEYIYGVWHSTTTKQAQQTILEVGENIKNASGLLAQFVTTGNSVQTTVPPEHLLPSNGELSGWVQSRASSTYEGKTLYRDRPSSPDLYYAYGFKRQAEVEYETPQFGSKPLILLEVFDMGSPENALGIYNFHTYPKMRFEWIGSKAMLSGNYLRFSKGKYFIQIEGYEIATGIREGMVALAKIIATQIKDPPPEPPILTLLPSRNKVNGSIKLFRSNWVLRQLYSTLPVNTPQLTDTAIGVSARYLDNTKSTNWTDAQIVFIIRFADTATAESAYTLYRDSLTKGKMPFEVGTSGNFLINEASSVGGVSNPNMKSLP
ncbi:hypothetical protein F4Y59_14260 [Candidatus Poribacteria bacterium]|nr:hypothetical protein [Candidatus Poribacteria bacterium]MYK17268.1 hypothetical protein [Candidatus Poribacteria bacterium]